MECNDKPRMKESPTQADSERIVDILFPSFFTSDETLWNDEKHIYPKDTLLKEQKWKNNHKNAFMNILIQYLLTLKNEANYNIEKYVPESVNQRSMAYLQDSFDIHNIFTSLFEKRSNDSSIIASYKDSRGNFNDTDWP